MHSKMKQIVTLIALVQLVFFICVMTWWHKTEFMAELLPHTWTNLNGDLKNIHARYAQAILNRLSVSSEMHVGEIRMLLLCSWARQSFACPGATNCVVNTTMRNFPTAHFVIFFNGAPINTTRAFPEQRWAYGTGESPVRILTPNSSQMSEFDWFTTVHPTSTVPFSYALYVPFNNLSTVTSRHPDGTSKVIEPTNSLHALLPSFHKDRTKKAVWVVSNLKPKSQRNEYVKELSKYIQVDVFGAGSPDRKHFCPNRSREQCFHDLSLRYKFYIAFENSLCRYYITEKYFENALITGMVPVVMGAPPEDYKRFGPPNSYIHVDNFASPMELAKYLTYLDNNDTAYAEYFTWKKEGYVKVLKIEHIMCQYCHILHSEIKKGIKRRKNRSKNERVVADYISQNNRSCIKSGRWPINMD